MESQRISPSAKRLQRQSRPSLDTLWLSGTLDRKKTVFEVPTSKKTKNTTIPLTPPADDDQLRQDFQKLDTEIVTDGVGSSPAEQKSTIPPKPTVDHDVEGAAEGSVAAILRREIKDTWHRECGNPMGTKPTLRTRRTDTSNTKDTQAMSNPARAILSDASQVNTNEITGTDKSSDTTTSTKDTAVVDNSGVNNTPCVLRRKTVTRSVMDTRRNTLPESSSLLVPNSRLRAPSASEGVRKSSNIDECVCCAKKVFMHRSEIRLSSQFVILAVWHLLFLVTSTKIQCSDLG
eukprot:m.230986 g.230986  ORF g.230986 m.230986 type:complete len:290 (+) comp19263_c1_seq5:316-1185(+)